MNMNDSPGSLQSICVEFISGNLNSVFATVEDVNGNILKHVFRDNSIYLPVSVSELLLLALNKIKLTDQILTLFNPSFTRLCDVYIKDASHLTCKGLRVLRSHKISELVVIKLVHATVNDLIGCLGEWTLQNIRLLNVSQSTFGYSEKVRVIIALSKLKKLKCLDVSFTEFNSQGLQIIASDLPCLESLNISGTLVSDISHLRNCKDRLKSLTMYNLKLSCLKDSVQVVSELRNLQHLDISDDYGEPHFNSDENSDVKFADLFEALNRLPSLVSLDLSGRHVSDVNSLKNFLNSHKKLQFLGLMENPACKDDMFCRPTDPMFNPKLVVTGFATENQVLEALRRYTQRRLYVVKSLCYLYADIQNLPDVRVDIIELVLEGMKAFPLALGIQVAATACLYNLTKGSLNTKIHPNWLRKIVECTLLSMENFPNQLQLQKNALLTLCSDRMLQDVSFNRYHCAELVMNSLMAFDDPAMNRMSVAICSILAARISTVETSNLGAKTNYMNRLLDIVKTKKEQGDIDIMMKFTLSALWNLTDESPKTCGVFLHLGGLQLFLSVLVKFAGESAVETKVLGLMNNIAEVSHLRVHLMKDNFITALRSLLHSRHIDVSYFAAGIVAHLTSEGESFWYFWNQNNWSEMVTELGTTVMNWDVPATEMVAYRSFNPFYPLFQCFKAYQVQLWAAWAVHHVCLKNPKRYCKMLVEEGGVEILRSLLKTPELHSAVAHLCNEILQFIKEEFPNI
ncbi:protein zyg-11 homolog B [Trichonephila clavata]|uniref:Protein zyg-11 homolog B n=1 Tax=Trichonephila clavata TaxID=2740835 RepID=A0A8X6IJP2_TRICU|nr:protein zyg-11 homolog B [Trichonephila clavata]